MCVRVYVGVGVGVRYHNIHNPRPAAPSFSVSCRISQDTPPHLVLAVLCVCVLSQHAQPNAITNGAPCLENPMPCA